LEPSVRGGPPTFLGMDDVLFGGGAEDKVLPGCEKASVDSLPQQLPIVSWLGENLRRADNNWG
jgi:hypothetical protein